MVNMLAVMALFASIAASWQITFFLISHSCDDIETASTLTYTSAEGVDKIPCMVAGLSAPGVVATYKNYYTSVSAPINANTASILVPIGSSCYWSTENTCLEGGGTATATKENACVAGGGPGWFEPGAELWFFCEEARDAF